MLRFLQDQTHIHTLIEDGSTDLDCALLPLFFLPDLVHLVAYNNIVACAILPGRPVKSLCVEHQQNTHFGEGKYIEHLSVIAPETPFDYSAPFPRVRHLEFREVGRICYMTFLTYSFIAVDNIANIARYH